MKFGFFDDSPIYSVYLITGKNLGRFAIIVFLVTVVRSPLFIEEVILTSTSKIERTKLFFNAKNREASSFKGNSIKTFRRQKIG